MGKRGGQKLGVGVSGAQPPAPKGVTDEMYSEIQYSAYKSSAYSTNEANTIHSYTNMGYNINTAIYKNTLTQEDKAYIRNLNASLDTLPAYKSKEPLYRGYNDYKQDFKNVAAGDEFTLHTFTSTSRSEKKATGGLLIKTWKVCLFQSEIKPAGNC